MARTVFRPARILCLLTSALLVAGLTTAVAPPLRTTAEAAAPAASDARPGELVNHRTRTSMTIRQGDGTMRTILSAAALHYWTAGGWKRIDNELTAADEAGYAYRNKANSFRAQFKGALDGEYLQVSSAGRDFGLSLEGAGRPAAKAAANNVVYPHALGNVDLRYDLVSDGVKETLVLPDASSPSTYHFLLSASGNAAFRAERRSDGSWAFFSGTALAPVFLLDAPMAVDAGAQPSTARNATLDVKKVGRGFALTLDLDRGWLSAPGRRFPVRLDPTITVNPPVEDTSFAATCANCTPYVSDKIYTGTDSANAWRGALQFDLGGIPAGADVTSASLEAYWQPLCLTAGTGFCNGTTHQIDAHLMTKSWTTASTSGALGYGTTPIASATVSPSAVGTSPSWVSWPITSTLRGWQAGSSANFGVLLKRATEPLNASGPVFYGRRNSDPALAPRLVVTYPGDGVNLLPPATLHSDGADLRWTPYPSDATTPFAGYELHRSTVASFTPDASTRLTTVTDRAVTSYRDTTAAAGQSFTYKVVTGSVVSSGRTVTLPAVGQASKILQPAAEDGVGTTIAYFPSVVNCAGYGAENLLWVGPQSDATNRALLRFDLRDVPAGATITSAVVSAWHPYTISTAQTVRAYPATADWSEGTAHSTCSQDSATWYNGYGGVPWAANGGDYDGTAAATVTHAGGELPAFDNFDITALAAKWVTGAVPNHGLVLRQDQETPGTGSLLSYHSDDFSVAPSLRPKLVVSYADGSKPVAPTVAVSAPLTGATVGGSVSLAAAATDDRRVDQVDFLVDGTVVGSDSTVPFGMNWNAAGASAGSHTVTVRATDDAGNTTTSSAATVTVDNSAVPSTAVTSPTPAAGSSVSGYRDAVNADHPIGWWRLGEASGPAVADASGSNRTGALVGTPVLGARGALGSDPDTGMQSSTSNDDYAAVPANSQWALDGSFTLEWWGSNPARQDYQWAGFLQSGSSLTGGDGWSVSWNTSGRLAGNVTFKRDGRQFDSSVLAGPAFRHYAVVYDKAAQTLQWYVDGQPDRAYTSVAFTPWNSVAHSLNLGRGDQPSAVRVDEPALYATALSAGRVAAHRTAGVAAAPEVTGAVPVAANAADDRGVTAVDFLADGVRYATDTTAPYQATWNTADPTATVPDGVHVLTTTAYDTSGQATISAAVPVTVANAKGTQYVGTTGTTDVPDLIPADPAVTQPVQVSVTNDSTVSWPSTTTVDSSWISHDATPVATTGASAALGATLAPGATTTVSLNVPPPVLPDGAQQAAYTLKVDLKDTATGTSYAAKGNKPVTNDVQVAKSLEDTLGLERWHEYRGTDLGAGVQNLVDIANGNNLWRWTPSDSPGRGLSTVVDLTYNSLEKSGPSPVGPGVSLSISSLSRLGLPIDIHPNKADTIGGNAKRYVVFTDGDGTTHRFDGVANGDGTWRYESPPGVHLYLRPTGSTDPARTWAFSRPDRVTFYYDDEGYPTSVEDANGNRITYTLERIPPGEDGGPVKKRVTAVTDAGGRGYQLDYWSKDEVKKAQVRGELQRLTDHSGSAWDFDYYDDGNLRVITQRGGTKADGSALADRRIVFTYTTSNGDAPAISDPALRVDPDPKTPNQSALVYSIRDPRGAETRFSYYGPGSSQLRGRVNTVTDRSGAVTTYTYDLTAHTTTAAAPLSRTQTYTWDALGRATVLHNALGQDTTLTWNADNKVVTLTEPTGKTLRYTYNANGYLTSTTDQLNHTTLLEMQDVAADANDVSGKWQAGRTIPHYSQLRYKTSPRGTATATVGDYRWSFDYDARGNLIATTDPTGARKALTINADGTVADETDARGGKTTYSGYDANGFPAAVIDPLARRTQFGYDSDGQLIWTQGAKHTSYTTGSPRDYRTYFDYDAFGRMGRQSTPKSTATERGTLIWSGADFDANDNTVTEIDQHYGQQYSPGIAFQTKHAYDSMDRETLRTAMDTSVDPSGERTSMSYDAAGRMTRRVMPLGVQSTTIANDYAVDLSYDLLDRTVRQAGYEVDSAGVQKSVQYTHTCYDLAGDAVRRVSPRANLASISCTDDTVPYLTRTSYDAAHRQVSVTDAAGRVKSTGYDENDNVVSRTDEAGKVETTEFDQRDLPVKTVQPFIGGATPRTLTTQIEYDANGNRSRVITPRAYDASSDKITFTNFVTRYVYDAANQLTRTDLPSTGAADQHYKHMAYDAVGNPTTTTQDVAQAALSDVPQNLREDRGYFDPSGWVRTSDDHVNPVLHFDYDASGRQASRTPEKKGSSELNLDDRQEWRYFIDGMLRERSDNGGQKITYTYDADNVTRTVTDASGANANRQRTMTVQISPDGLGRPAKTRQRKSDETRWKATLSSFDLGNNVVQRIDDREEDDAGSQLKAGRQNDYTFDATNRLTQQLDQGKDTQASTSDDTRITTSYLPQGWELQRTTDKYVPGGSPVWQPKKVQDWTYYDNGQLKTMSTKNGSGTVLESHDVSYVDSGIYLNGNQVSDTFKRNSPNAGASCTSTTCIDHYRYDARDRLLHKDTEGTGVSSDYTLDPAGNVVKDTESDTGTTTNTYQGIQLDTSTAGGTTTKSHYDTHGNLDCVTGAGGTDADCNGSSALVNYSYDGLDRLTGYKDAAGTDTSYEYDALDRQTRQEKHGSTGGPTTNFSYLGLSGKVTKEEQLGSGGAISRTKDYSYDAYGSANGMTDTQTGQASKSYAYGKDPQGSISQLIDDAGKAAAAYGYKPYGDNDSALSAGDTNKNDPINPVRFTEKRYDSGSGTLDMGARRFGPSNRFLQEDRYSDALSDLDLGTDPLTSNRYSLAGGNPANFVEVDGHFSIGGMLGDAKDALSDAGDAIGDAASAAGKFVSDNKVAIGSIAAGAACGALTAGIAAAGCAAGVAAVSGAIEAKSECKGDGTSCYVKKIGTSVALTAVGGVAGKLAKAGLAKVAARTLGRESDDAARGASAADTGSSGGSGGAAAVRRGQAGEAAVAAEYDIGPKATRFVNGNKRIFDGLNDEAVSEVKNVKYQAYTQQLKDSLAYARKTGRRFDLYTRPDTKLSRPLRDAIRQGHINRLDIPFKK